MSENESSERTPQGQESEQLQPFGAEANNDIQENTLSSSTSAEEPSDSNSTTEQSSTTSESEIPPASQETAATSSSESPGEGVQVNMFQKQGEYEKQKRMNELHSEIAEAREKLQARLKKTSAFLKLLKLAPETITDIYFRCNEARLSAETLTLYGNQSSELALLFFQCKDAIDAILEKEPEHAQLRVDLGYVRDSTTGSWNRDEERRLEKLTPQDLEKEGTKIINGEAEEEGEEEPTEIGEEAARAAMEATAAGGAAADPFAEQQQGGPI